MRTIIILCLSIALLRLAIGAVVIIALVTLMLAAINYPKETFGFVSLMVIMGIAERHPLGAFIGLLVCSGLYVVAPPKTEL